jgi:predicted enzyme related to lactoylglutathione lyase
LARVLLTRWYNAIMLNCMFPELFVSDCEVAARFFENALGFLRGYTLMENGHLDFAVMKHPDAKCDLLLHQMLPAEESGKPRDVRLWFETRDINALVNSLRQKGFAISSPRSTSYGALEAQLPGPDGYEICLRQWLRGKSS